MNEFEWQIDGFTSAPLAAGFMAVASLLVWAGIILERRRRAAFDRKFPPISDAEFMERCTVGTNPAVALKVRRIVADQLGIEYERIYPESSFVNDLGV